MQYIYIYLVKKNIKLNINNIKKYILNIIWYEIKIYNKNIKKYIWY